MKWTNRVGRICALLAAVSIAIPETARATHPGQGGYAVSESASDVALDDQGRLQGIVLDKTGRPLALASVAVSQSGRPVAAIQTDYQGRFAVAGLRGGVYQVQAPHRTAVVRLWAPRTAPPGAADRLVITPASDTVRAQGGGGIMQFVTNPWVLGGVVAAAIAIPLALDDDDENAS